MSDLQARPEAQPSPAPQWVPSPLLLRPRETPRFLRAPWDNERSDAFGPWRVAARVDPALPLEQGAPEERRAVPGEGAGAGAGDSAGVAATEVAALAAPSTPQPAAASDVTGISHEAFAHAEAQAHARGLEEGRAQALAGIESVRAHEAEVMRHLLIEMRALKEDPDRFYEPLRRLALHIAEQLVRGELQTSAQAIAQIVSQCLSTLDAPGAGAGVVVCLHPEDAAMLEASKPDFMQDARVQPDPALHRGSVRLRMDDTLLEDLIEHRLDAIAQRLLAQPRARAGSSASVLMRETFPAEAMDSPARRPRAAGAPGASSARGEVIDATAIPVPNAPDAPFEPEPSGLQMPPASWQEIDLNLNLDAGLPPQPRE